MLDATVAGTITANGPGSPRMDAEAMATINIEDATVKLVEAKPQAELDAAIKAAGADAELTVDDMVTIMGSALFDAAEGATVIYSAMSSATTVATASVSVGEIMVTAKGKGDAMITIEASASMGSGVKANPQTEPDRASVEIPIAVALAPLSVMLEGPDAGMNLVEGMEYTITAKANRAVEMDTMVELLQTAGSASPEDYTVENITISSGESMGTTKLMVKEDNMSENEGNMEESLTIEGRVGTMKTTNSLMFYLWDVAVPALPDHRAAPAGGLPRHRRLPPLSSAVAFGGGVRNSPLPPLPGTPPGGGGLSFPGARSLCGCRGINVARQSRHDGRRAFVSTAGPREVSRCWLT